MCTTLLSVLMFNMLFAQLYDAPDSLWAHTYHGRGLDESPSIIQTHDGGYMIAGATENQSGRERNGFLVKTDSEGNEIWEREYEHVNGFCAVIQLSDSSFMLGGNSKSSDSGRGACLLKINTLGEQISLNVYGGWCADIVQASDCGFALAGKKRISGTVNDEFYLQKIDSNGIKQWEKIYAGIGDESCEAIIQTEDDGFALAGVTHTNHDDFFLVKTDEGGNLLWSSNYGLDGNENDKCLSLVQTSDKGFALLGTTNPSKYVSQGDLYFVKTDSVGNEMWSRFYGQDEHDEGKSITLLADGGFILAGSMGFQGKDYKKNRKIGFYLVRTDPVGNELWSRVFGGRGFNYCESVIQTLDGGFALIGNTSSRTGPNGFLLVKTGPERFAK